jgi:hypothetical protein
MIPSEIVVFEYFIIQETKVSKPQISPSFGTFISFVDVTISTSTAGAEIYYSTDGSAPSASSPTSTLYNASQPIRVEYDTNIKAVAVKSGLQSSDVASAMLYVHPYMAPTMQEVTNDDGSLIGGSAIVRWSIGNAEGVTGFRIKYGTESGVYGYTYNVTNPGLRMAVISNLSNGVRYYFSIVAMYGSNESELAGEINCLVRDVHAPAPPSNLTATITGDGLGVLLRWKNPSVDFDHVVLVKNSNHQPTSINDGTVIYTGAAEEFIDRNI